MTSKTSEVRQGPSETPPGELAWGMKFLRAILVFLACAVIFGGAGYSATTYARFAAYNEPKNSVILAFGLGGSFIGFLTLVALALTFGRLKKT